MIPDFRGTHLFERLCWAQENLKPVQTKYAIVYEDPATPEEPVKIVHAAPEWMACALAGGILPPISSYVDLPLRLILEDDTVVETTYVGAQDIRTKHNVKYEEVMEHHQLHCEPIEPMTEEQAIEYLLMKDVPARVWCQSIKHNRPMFKIVTRDQLPTDRTYRNSWILKRDE